MSHYSVAVITYDDSWDAVDDLLEPFDENKEVEPYIDMTKEDLIAEAKDNKTDWINHLHTYDAETLFEILTNPSYSFTRSLLNCETDEDFLNYQRKAYDLDENDNLWSTYNPDSKWDWYSVGGCWSGSFYNYKEGYWCDTVKISDWDMDFFDDEHDMFKSTYAVITPDGEWHAPGKMGWFACSSETKEEMDAWVRKYKREMMKADPEWYITIVDCHI